MPKHEAGLKELPGLFNLRYNEVQEQVFQRLSLRLEMLCNANFGFPADDESNIAFGGTWGLIGHAGSFCAKRGFWTRRGDKTNSRADRAYLL